MGIPHVLAIPHPAQGHVIPMMELSQCLVRHGFKVTFVNTVTNHKRIVNALAETTMDSIGDQIHLVSLPDGTETLGGDTKKLGDLTKVMSVVMPRNLEELINEINSSDGDKITCMIADLSLGWALEVAVKMGIKRAGFCASAAAILIMAKSIPKLIDEGVIDKDGTPIRKTYQLFPNMPAVNTKHFLWACMGNLDRQKIFFELAVSSNKVLKSVDKLICNSAYDLEPAAFTMAPEIIPVGPLLASTRLGSSVGFFLAEDPTCVTWLDQQPPLSVIYISFGSLVVFEQTQFHELAMGLELSNKRFLWVVRSDETKENYNVYPAGFEERVVTCGKIVGWAPQQKVLSHPSVACFITHCGWNSTIEAVSNGVPLLCWPCFADQSFNQSYICDFWKVGLALDRDERGIITRNEIKNKVEQILDKNSKFKAAALDHKEMAMSNVSKGGRSYNNIKNLNDWIKG